MQKFKTGQVVKYIPGVYAITEMQYKVGWSQTMEDTAIRAEKLIVGDIKSMWIRVTVHHPSDFITSYDTLAIPAECLSIVAESEEELESQMQQNKHKHADLLIAYAKNKNIEIQVKIGSTWYDHEKPYDFPESMELRIKPEPVKMYLMLYKAKSQATPRISVECYKNVEHFKEENRITEFEWVKVIEETEIFVNPT